MWFCDSPPATGSSAVSKKIIICSVAFMLGIVLANVFNLHIHWAVLFLFMPLIILFWQNKKALLNVLILLCFVLGWVHFVYSTPNITPNHIGFYNNGAGLEWGQMEDVIWRGVVVKEPDKRIDHTKLTVLSSAVLEGDKWRGVSGLVLVKASLYPEFDLGDYLKISCKLVSPSKINDFSYDDYLSRYNIYSLCYGPSIQLLSANSNNSFRSLILEIKDKIHLKIQKNIVEPEASVLSAMLLARRRNIPTDISNNFSRAGVSHLLAISGMHISIISLLIARFLSSLGVAKKYSYFSTFLLLFVYILMIGWPASAVRAGIMGSIVLLAEYFGRINKSYFALILVATFTLLINPKLIVYDIGWQLSFLAVLSLILFSDDLERLFARLPKLFGIKSILQTTFAAQILTLPWLAYKFGQVSLVFPLANILLLPALPIIMSLSIITIIISFIFPLMSLPMFWLIWNLLNKQIEVVNWLGAMPLAVISLPEIKFIYVLVIYMYIFFVKFLKPAKPHHAKTN